MAVSDQQAQKDLYWPMDFRDDDQRVALGGWVFYVRAVRTRRELTNVPLGVSGNLLGDLVVGPVMTWGYEKWGSRRPWRVGVVRLGASSTWNDVRPEVVHFEELQMGAEPASRIAELAEEARAGRYLPAP